MNKYDILKDEISSLKSQKKYIENIKEEKIEGTIEGFRLEYSSGCGYKVLKPSETLMKRLMDIIEDHEKEVESQLEYLTAKFTKIEELLEC